MVWTRCTISPRTLLAIRKRNVLPAIGCLIGMNPSINLPMSTAVSEACQHRPAPFITRSPRFLARSDAAAGVSGWVFPTDEATAPCS